MRSLMNILVFTSATIFLIMVVKAELLIREEHSLGPPFDESNVNLRFWDLTGTAQLTPTAIRLTTDEPYKRGAIWNNHPVFLRNWEIQVHYHIHGKGVNLYGEGLAIWYVRDPLQLGPVFGGKDYYSGAGVFLDTYEHHPDPHKHSHPYFSAMINNGSQHYDHDEDGTYMQLGGCYGKARNMEYPTKFAVTYLNNSLSVYIDSDGTNQWLVCFRTPDVYLPTGYYFGISASTGELSDNHDIVKITTLDLDDRIATDSSADYSGIIPRAEQYQIPIFKAEPSNEEQGTKKQVKTPKKTPKEKKIDKKQVMEAVQPAEDYHKLLMEEPHIVEERKAYQEAKQQREKRYAWIMRGLYALGGVLTLILVVSLCRRAHAQRQIRMQKRLY